MGKVHVPLVRRGIGALGHVAQVAHIALVDHLDVVGSGYAIDFTGVAFIYQIEQGRKGIAKADATATSVADIEDALQLVQTFFFIVKIGILPIDRMTGWRFQIAFTTHDLPLADIVGSDNKKANKKTRVPAKLTSWRPWLLL
jgi:hypothetical protein